MTDKTCFIMMPLSITNELLSIYKGNSDHFLNVMKYLFKPAIEKAGFKPIFPKVQGSEIIHAEIIHNIESSDLVLCDMSILNPNVFFELGIRTALNKPVCLIKDNVVEKVPFDTNIINYHTYSSDMSIWIVLDEIEKLADHIKESYSKSNNFNSLWRYFSLKSIATMDVNLDNNNGKMEYLIMEVEAMRKQLTLKEDFKLNELKSREKMVILDIEKIIKKYFKFDYYIKCSFDESPSNATITYSMKESIPSEAEYELKGIENFYGIKIQLYDYAD